jgi:hypothetical protein
MLHVGTRDCSHPVTQGNCPLLVIRLEFMKNRPWLLRFLHCSWRILPVLEGTKDREQRRASSPLTPSALIAPESLRNYFQSSLVSCLRNKVQGKKDTSSCRCSVPFEAQSHKRISQTTTRTTVGEIDKGDLTEEMANSWGSNSFKLPYCEFPWRWRLQHFEPSSLDNSLRTRSLFPVLKAYHLSITDFSHWTASGVLMLIWRSKIAVLVWDLTWTSVYMYRGLQDWRSWYRLKQMSSSSRFGNASYYDAWCQERLWHAVRSQAYTTRIFQTIQQKDATRW